MKHLTLTAIIIAKNEESMLPECLESVGFADEVMVIDNSSTDATAKIAKEKGAKVITSDAIDFATLREIGLKKSKTEFVLYIDADERVSPELRSEIESVLEKPEKNAYRIPRKNFYLGDNAWPTIEHLERLFKRSALEGWRGKLHETAVVTGEIGNLTAPLLHYTHRDFSSMVEKTNNWSETEAQLRFAASHPKISWWRFPRVMLQAFFESYIKQQGWKVGTAGLLESMYQAFSIFITYAKLWEMQERKKKG